MARPDKARKRTWRFKLDDSTILEVSAPRGATEKQVRRRGRISLVLGTIIAAMMISAVAVASVSTDQQDYSPGSVVTISGDNSDGAGYLAGETVVVDVSGPNGFDASCEALADENGAWSCQVTLWDSELAVGEYAYTATGQTSGVAEHGTFTDAISINSFASDCSTGGDSFTSGTTVCAKATGLAGGGGGSSGRIEWWAPLAASATRTTTFTGVSGNTTDSFAPSVCGTWTLKVYSPAATFEDDDTFAVTGCAPANSAPEIAADNASVTVNEGQTAANTGTWSDPNAGDTVTLSASVGSVAKIGTNASGTWSWSFATTDGPDQTQTVTITANDGSTSTSTTFALTVNNVAPTVAVTGLTSVDESSTPVTYTYSISDPGADTVQSVSTSCGTLGTKSGDTNTDTSGSFKCTFADGVVPPLTSDVTVQATDSDGLAGNTDKKVVTVSNVAPSVAKPTFSGAVDCRQAVTLSGISFSDPGVNDDPWTVSIDWGDGSTDTSYTTNTQGSQSNQTHTYNTPGFYGATVTVTDKDGEGGSNTSSNTVEVKQAYTVGFRQPIDPSNSTRLVGNTFKSGRVVPVKATIYDVCTQAYVNDPATNVTIVIRDGGMGNLGSNDAVEVFADPGAANSNTLLFRWTSDATVPGGGFWIYNLDSKTVLDGSPMVVGHNYRVDIFVGANRATSSQWAVLTPTK